MYLQNELTNVTTTADTLFFVSAKKIYFKYQKRKFKQAIDTFCVEFNFTESKQRKVWFVWK